jgi:hypothetical protein
MNKITLFIVDDNIPKSAENINDAIFETPLNKEQLLVLAEQKDWKSEKSLQKIVSLLSKHSYTKEGLIDFYGFIHPEICLQEIENGINPTIIIYDWEYGDSFSNKKSGELLLEILSESDAFVFVYSGVKGQIPATLNKQIFDQYADRFQLFGKGDSEASIYSSEEFIYQYILNRVTQNNTIKIHDNDVSFKENGYLETPTDILYLEKIFGKSFLIEKLKNIQDISDRSIENIFDSIEGEILFDETNGFLISPNEGILVGRFSPQKHLSYLEVLKLYGVKNLEIVLSSGIVKV